METVKVNRQQLLTTVKANRELHVKDYEEALEGWKKAQEVALRKTLKTFLKNATDLAARHDWRDPILLQKPRSHEEDYDRAIRLLELCVEEEFELPVSDFDQWVMDKWQWHHEFVGTKSLYASGSLTTSK